MKRELPQFALLIDADNVDKQTITPIIEEVTRHGRIAVRRICGDFTTPNLGDRKDTRSYGATNFIKLIRAAEIFELDERKLCGACELTAVSVRGITQPSH